MSVVKGPVGSLTVICGCMFSGKTDELIRLVRRSLHARKRVQVFKSGMDTRCDASTIRTHDDMRFQAMTVASSKELESLLEPTVQVVGIEEVQFLDEGVVGVCRRLADRGVQVIVAGLDQDFRGQPFGVMPTLLAYAENVQKLHAICKVCGGEATRTQRLVDGRPAAWDEPTILIGADESYEARCRRCHVVRNVPREVRGEAGSAGNGKNGGNGTRLHRSGKASSLVKEGADGATYLPHFTQLEMFAECAEEKVSEEAV